MTYIGHTKSQSNLFLNLFSLCLGDFVVYMYVLKQARARGRAVWGFVAFTEVLNIKLYIKKIL